MIGWKINLHQNQAKRISELCLFATVTMHSKSFTSCRNTGHLFVVVCFCPFTLRFLVCNKTNKQKRRWFWCYVRSSIKMSKQEINAALKKTNDLASSAPVIVYRSYYPQNVLSQDSVYIIWWLWCNFYLLLFFAVIFSLFFCFSFLAFYYELWASLQVLNFSSCSKTYCGYLTS